MKTPKLSDYVVTRVETSEYRNQRLDRIDFSSQRLEHLRFYDCTLTNCSFDYARCRDIRMWGTTLRDCTFRKADLRDSALGGVQDGKCNQFERVLFDQTDMRGTAYLSAVFTDCAFNKAKLTKVDFEGSRFSRCTFRGELREVFFDRHGFRGESLEPNRMENVDFSGAQLRWVQFRRLDLATVTLPSDDNHIIIRNYPAFVDYSLHELKGATNLADRGLRGLLQSEKKWLAPGRTIGVINRLDPLESAHGDEALLRLSQLLANAQSTTS